MVGSCELEYTLNDRRGQRVTILDPVSRKYIAVYARRKSTYSWTIEKKKKLVEKVATRIS